MDRKNIGVLVLVLIILIAISFALKMSLDGISQGNEQMRNTPDPVIENLSEEISRYQTGEVSIIDLSKTTEFSWDHLYIFGDYTQASTLDNIIGRSWRKNCYTQIGSSDGYALLVFVEANIVVHCTDYPKNINIFLISPQGYGKAISLDKALFVLDENGRIKWIGDE